MTMRNRRLRVPRRSVLQLGVCGLSALAFPQSAFSATDRKAKAKNVLVIFEQGGVSHLDTWDPKPDIAAEHRSPFKPIATKVPGLQVTELLKQTALHAEKLTVIRCMTQPTPGIGNSHAKGSQYIFSGEAPGGPMEMPDIGSAVS